MIEERRPVHRGYHFVLLSPFSDALWSDVSPRLEHFGQVSILRLQGKNTIEGFATEVAPLVDKRCIVVGFCIGGSVALAAARTGPQLAGIVLISCMPLPDSERQRLARLDKIDRLRIKVAEGGKSPDVDYAKLAADWMLSRHSLMADPVRCRSERILGELTPQKALDNHIAMLNRPDLSGDFFAFNRPLLILVGQHDRIVNAKTVLDLVARAPRVRAVVLPKCGHMAPVEMPQLVTDSIENWMAGI